MWLREKLLTTETALHHSMEGFWSTVSVTYDGLLEYDIINGLGKTTPTLKTY